MNFILIIDIIVIIFIEEYQIISPFITSGYCIYIYIGLGINTIVIILIIYNFISIANYIQFNNNYKKHMKIVHYVYIYSIIMIITN